MSEHNDRVVSEFSRQANRYAKSPPLTDLAALDLLAETARVIPEDTVLDVACGPGVVSCYLAERARSVVGIDLTEAMLEQARLLQRRSALANVSWIRGDVNELPLPDGSFSLVVSRYAFHHLLEPKGALQEMLRVCSEGGRVAIVDIAPANDELAQSLNLAEGLRDPSHVRALTLREQEDLLRHAGLSIDASAQYGVEYELELLLEAASATEEDKSTIADLFSECSTLLEIHAGMTFVRYPISVLVASRPG